MTYQKVCSLVDTTANKCNSVMLKAPAAEKTWSLLVQLTTEPKHGSLKRS